MSLHILIYKQIYNCYWRDRYLTRSTVFCKFLPNERLSFLIYKKECSFVFYFTRSNWICNYKYRKMVRNFSFDDSHFDLWYYVFQKFYRFLALNVLHIFVFVYYGFYEITFFFSIACISFKIGKTMKGRKKEKIWHDKDLNQCSMTQEIRLKLFTDYKTNS